MDDCHTRSARQEWGGRPLNGGSPQSVSRTLGFWCRALSRERRFPSARVSSGEWLKLPWSTPRAVCVAITSHQALAGPRLPPPGWPREATLSVWLPFALRIAFAVLAHMMQGAQADGAPDDLTGGPPVIKPEYPRLASHLNRLVEHVAAGDALPASASESPHGAVEMMVRFGTSAAGMPTLVESHRATVLNAGDRIIEARAPVSMLPILERDSA